MDGVRTGLWVTAGALILITIWQIGSRIYQKMRSDGMTTATEELPTPTLAFDALPKVAFANQAKVTRPQTYELTMAGIDTKKNTGWPTFGELTAVGATMAPVYKLNPFNFSLTAEQRARQIATNLSFSAAPKILDGQTYLFSYPGPPLKESLEINLKTMFVTLTTDYLSVDNVFALTKANGEKYLPDRTSAIAAVRNYLSVAQILPDDLSDAAATVEYAKGVGSKLELVTNVLEGEFVTVNLPRAPLEGWRNGEPTTYNFYGPDNVSSIYGVVGRAYDAATAETRDVVVQLNDYYYSLETSNEATYYLRTVAEAWQSLQAGEAYIINPRNLETVKITDVKLGYYESHEEQEYLLPIYVFFGENDFMAYTQALHPNMLVSN